MESNRSNAGCFLQILIVEFHGGNLVAAFPNGAESKNPLGCSSKVFVSHGETCA